MKITTVASSPTLEGITKLMNRYFYTTSIRIDGESIFNSIGKIEGYIVIQKKGRYIVGMTGTTNGGE